MATRGVGLKRYHPGITDKRLNNRRFYRTEEAILRAFFDSNGFTGVGKVTQKAGVARSTFYHHHRAVDKIITDYKNYILLKYKKMVKGILNSKNVSIRVLYSKTIFFIIHNKKVFKILLMGEDNEVFENMVLRLQPSLVSLMRLPKNSEKIFLVYTGEVVALLSDWCKNGAHEDNIGHLLDELLYLTDTARIRLKILL